MQTKIIAEAYAKFYENLTPKTTLEEYSVFFDKHSKFKDPFQEVQGLNAIHNIFVNMYTTLHNPYFKVEEIVCSSELVYLRWEFYYSRSKEQEMESFTGVSRVTFTASAKVVSHIDYWDAAENVYEKIPLLGSIIRFIKQKIHA